MREPAGPVVRDARSPSEAEPTSAGRRVALVQRLDEGESPVGRPALQPRLSAPLTRSGAP